MRVWNHFAAINMAKCASGSFSRFHCRVDGRNRTGDDNGNQSAAKPFFRVYQTDILSFQHCVKTFDLSDQALHFQNSQRVHYKLHSAADGCGNSHMLLMPPATHLWQSYGTLSVCVCKFVEIFAPLSIPAKQVFREQKMPSDTDS